MRYLTGLLTCLVLGAWAYAWAADPPASTAAASQAGQPPAASSAATATATETASTQHDSQPASPQPDAKATASAPATAAASASKSGKPELTHEDQLLIARGYKLEMHKGQKVFCRRESIIGSHFETKHCSTAEAIDSQRTDAQETTRVMQSIKPQISQ